MEHTRRPFSILEMPGEFLARLGTYLESEEGIAVYRRARKIRVRKQLLALIEEECWYRTLGRDVALTLFTLEHSTKEVVDAYFAYMVPHISHPKGVVEAHRLHAHILNRRGEATRLAALPKGVLMLALAFLEVRPTGSLYHAMTNSRGIYDMFAEELTRRRRCKNKKA